MTKLDWFWMTNDEYLDFVDNHFVLKDDAPQKYKESYETFLKQKKAAEEGRAL